MTPLVPQGENLCEGFHAQSSFSLTDTQTVSSIETHFYPILWTQLHLTGNRMGAFLHKEGWPSPWTVKVQTSAPPTNTVQDGGIQTAVVAVFLPNYAGVTQSGRNETWHDETDFAQPTGDADVPQGGAEKDVKVNSHGSLPTHHFPQGEVTPQPQRDVKWLHVTTTTETTVTLQTLYSLLLVKKQLFEAWWETRARENFCLF